MAQLAAPGLAGQTVHLFDGLLGGPGDTGILSQDGLPAAVPLDVDSGVTEVSAHVSIPPMSLVDRPPYNHASCTVDARRHLGVFHARISERTSAYASHDSGFVDTVPMLGIAV